MEQGGRGGRGDKSALLGSLLDHTCPCMSVVMDRCSLRRQLFTGGSAAAQLFLTAPGKISLREKVQSREVVLHRAQWSISFAPGFTPICVLAELWGQQPPPDEQWGTPGQGNTFPHGTWSWEEFGNNLYQHKITKRESELAQYLC